MSIDSVSSPAPLEIRDVRTMSLPVRGLLAVAGGVLGAARGVFPVVGMNGVDLFNTSSKAMKTITPWDAVSGRLYSEERTFDEIQRVPGAIKTLAWSAVGMSLGAAVALVPQASPLLATVAASLGTDSLPALMVSGVAAGAAARLVVNVYVTGALAALYGGVRGALLMARGTPFPLAD